VLDERAALQLACGRREVSEVVVEAGRLGSPRRARRTGHASQ